MPDARAHQARKPVLPISRACSGILLSTVSAPGDAVNAGRPSSTGPGCCPGVHLRIRRAEPKSHSAAVAHSAPGPLLVPPSRTASVATQGGIEVILLRFASRPSLPLPSPNAAPKTDANFLLARHLQLIWADARRQTEASAKLRKSEAWYEHTNPSAMATVLLTCSPSLSESGSGPKSHEVPSWEGRIAPGGVAGFKTPRYD